MRQHDEQRSNLPEGAFAQLSDYAQRRAVLAVPERISELGTRRLRRNRAGQAVMGTSAVAVVVLLGLGLTANGSNHVPSASTAGTVSVSGAATPAAAGPHTSLSLPPGARWHMMTMLGNSNAASLVASLQHVGFKSVKTEAVPSSTIPAGTAIDIRDAANRSVLGQTVSTGTPLTVLVSSGPAH